MEIIHAAARDAGRDHGAITVDRTITRVHADGVRPWDPEEWATWCRSWLFVGADQITFALVDLGFSPQDHLDVLQHLMAARRARWSPARVSWKAVMQLERFPFQARAHRA